MATSTQSTTTGAIVINGHAAAGMAGPALSADQLRPIVDRARALWAAGLAPVTDLSRLDSIRYELADLPGASLGWTTRTVEREYIITLDVDAAGFGWFVDATPGDSVEFAASGLMHAVRS